MIIVTLNICGLTSLELKKARYANHRLAIQLFVTETGEPWCTLTVNMPDDELAEGEFFVKTWSENADTTTALIEQTDLFTNTGRIVPAGYANACVWKFTDPKTWLRMRDL